MIRKKAGPMAKRLRLESVASAAVAAAPTVINSVYQQFQFWDGRAGSLEEQALGPIANPIEMNLPIEQAVARLAAIEGYAQQFQAVFGEPVNAENLGKAIAAFERTVTLGQFTLRSLQSR